MSSKPQPDPSDRSPKESRPLKSLFGARFFGGASAWLVSSLIHLLLMIVLGLWLTPAIIRTTLTELLVHDVEHEEDLVTMELDELIEAATEVKVAVASAAVSNIRSDLAGGIPQPQLDQAVSINQDATDFDIDSPMLDMPTSTRLIAEVPDGAMGEARAIVDNYDQAMDRITQEILWMLAKGKVLVIWCFDQSKSMQDDQEEIRDRIDRVYAELGLTGTGSSDVLTTAVTSFGQQFLVHTPRPTSNLAQIQTAMSSVPVDPSGKEMMCLAVGRSFAAFRAYAQRTQRQTAFVLVTDESGDPEEGNQYLEAAIAEARSARSRVYVLGRESVFGYPYAHISWIHPQTGRTHWLPIDRGPETGFVQQLQTDGFTRRHDAYPSGFGPYSQTRMARQTGGIFFMLPSLEAKLVRGEKRRYELEAMRTYRPDLRSRLELVADRDQSHMRKVLTKVVYDLNPYNEIAAKIIDMRVSFSPNPQQFAKEVVEAHLKVKFYLPYLDAAIHEIEKIRPMRDQDLSPRWRANYDLLHAQMMAIPPRIYEYAAYLEFFLKNPKVVPLRKDPNLILNHWGITTRSQTLVPEKTQPYIDRSSELLRAVIEAHPGTPWATRAQWELDRGFGIELIPVYYPEWRGGGGAPLIPIPKL